MTSLFVVRNGRLSRTCCYIKTALEHRLAPVQSALWFAFGELGYSNGTKFNGLVDFDKSAGQLMITDETFGTMISNTRLLHPK